MDDKAGGSQGEPDATVNGKGAAKLEVRGLVLDLGGRRVLDGVSLTVVEGETLCILGPSGAGKSQLLRAIVRLSRATGGTVLLDGLPTDGVSPVELRRAVVMVQQDPAMLDGTVEENVRYGLDLMGLPAEETRGRVGTALKEAFLDDGLLGRRAEKLSGGEQQRVALARALALEPQVLLLDEPTAALDPRAVQEVEGAIQRLRRETGLTMVIVTHNVEQARRLGDRTILIREGRVIASGDSESFLDQLGPEERAYYLGEMKRWRDGAEEAEESE
jgi:putative ABC transport system ATP-binding protein